MIFQHIAPATQMLPALLLLLLVVFANRCPCGHTCQASMGHAATSCITARSADARDLNGLCKVSFTIRNRLIRRLYCCKCAICPAVLA
jgi:hypothetical protein